MSFLVYERDPFVKADILDLLSRSFPDDPVFTLCQVEELHDALKNVTGQVIAVVSANPSDLESSVNLVDQRHAMVVVSDQDTGPARARDAWQMVPRPFSSEMLLGAIRNALSTLPSVPS